MATHPRAGQPALAHDLVDIHALLHAYHTRVPDPQRDEERVSFGTSGHRGSSLKGSFQALHIEALTQAILELRKEEGVDGPLFIGADSHALSAEALASARRVIAGHQRDGFAVDARFAPDDVLVATPLVSHAILTWNRDPNRARADGIIITPSHNPPADGGFKYNPATGGPAEPSTTDRIAARANALMQEPHLIRRMDVEASDTGRWTRYDFVARYVDDLSRVIDLEAIRAAGVRVGVDPLGGAALPVWTAIRDRLGLDVTILNDALDPQFAFMSLDHDGAIRMDCSSPYAMRTLTDSAHGFDVCVGNDPDADRHGIVTARGVMNPNHFLSLAVDHLLTTRTAWPTSAAIGRTVVTSALIDRVAASHGRSVMEVPVGFKWFVEGMCDRTLVFGGEESAGASFVDREGQPWSTDKDGILLGLLAAEMVAVRGESLDAQWDALRGRFGDVYYARRDAPAPASVRQRVKRMTPSDVQVRTLGGDAITNISPTARGNDAAIGGLRMDVANGWVAMRPSGTEDILKIYGESFVSDAHLQALLNDAEALVASVCAAADHIEGSRG